ncbi:MAG: hypothetical protein LUQ50_14685 [Methanospirillum sp.]|uniref:hypothetical protein n=1 Tax=Methanospirillum sp. TaxID=45200 RepID=UPI002375370D|nr:hypothetical protein [Methanospirillum sp.]MDD1730299.1 hypothetical protein [Methanospirillum sp.]
MITPGDAPSDESGGVSHQGALDRKNPTQPPSSPGTLSGRGIPDLIDHYSREYGFLRSPEMQPSPVQWDQESGCSGPVSWFVLFRSPPPERHFSRPGRKARFKKRI